MNSVNIIGTLGNHREEGEYLYVILDDGMGNKPTARFSGKQREAMNKWGAPGRTVAIAGSFGTEIVGKVKNSFINVAYSRFLDKQEKAAAPAPAPAPVVAAPAPAPAKAPSKAPSKGKKAASAPATPPDDGMPF